MRGTAWKRANYLIHRWVGIVLGLILLAWFVSGMVLMYYPYPVLTESAQDALLVPWRADGTVIPFPTAVGAALADFRRRGHPVETDPAANTVGGRLLMWNGHPAWQILHQRGYRIKPYLLVDAVSGRVLSPLTGDQAIAAASTGPLRGERVAGTELLPRGDHYFFWGTYHLEDLPAWRVRFDDDDATWMYVGRETGRVYARADRVARVATWFGTVPHWLYFMKLYEHPGLWTWLNLLLPGVAVIISLTGMVLGTYQLFPRRSRGSWQVSPYHGVSVWHHLSGVLFGVLVFTWTLSGVFEMLGAGNDPRPGQAEAVRAGALALDRLRVSPDSAVRAAAADAGDGDGRVLLVEVAQFLGDPGYRVRLADGRERWVDGATGRTRGELDREAALRAARRVLPDAPPVRAERLDAYDQYYYQRHGREMHLPVWRVGFGDEERSDLYLDTMTGRPTGFVGADTRLWRWLRDGMHSLDFHALVAHRPWWDLVVLPLMLGGALSSLTGVWLLLRRLVRVRRRRRLRG